MTRPENMQSLIHVSYDMGGKMKNIPSVSTSCKNNPFCAARYGDGMSKKDFMASIERGEHPLICKRCFAMMALSYKLGLIKNLNENSDVLANRLLDTEELFKLAFELTEASELNNSPLLRLESFGDIANETQATNYIKLSFAVTVLSGGNIRIAWWTKNWRILVNAWRETDEVIRKHLRESLNIVLSSPHIGIEVSEEDVRWVESELGMPVTVFTVDGKESERTNCGARDCFGCQRCYTKKAETEYVYEVVK